MTVIGNKKRVRTPLCECFSDAVQFAIQTGRGALVMPYRSETLTSEETTLAIESLCLLIDALGKKDAEIRELREGYDNAESDIDELMKTLDSTVKAIRETTIDPLREKAEQLKSNLEDSRDFADDINR